MSAYRFCRTDDIALLVDALNRCWAPYWPDEPLTTPASFKRSIRDLQVWCSSCMVAFSGADPIGVLIGAKRPSGTLVHRIAVHPDHRRQGHGRHMLTSLGSKLAILGPPRIFAEVPDTLAPARGLFRACGFVEDAVLTDYALPPQPQPQPTPPQPPPQLQQLPRDADSREREIEGRFVIPVTVDDLAANDLLAEANPQMCWSRSIETLTARKNDIAGLAIASDERIEAYVLYVTCGADAAAAVDASDILSLRSLVEDGGARLRHLLARLRAQAPGTRTLLLPKAHPAELPTALLDTLGFRAAGEHRRYAATARSD